MGRTLPLGTEVQDQFPVWGTDGYTKVSGITSFEARLWWNGILAGQPVTIQEIGTSGEYRARFTPNAVGYWFLEIAVPYNNDIWAAAYDIEQRQFDIQASMADDGTDATLALWCEEDGVRVLDVDQIAAQVRDSEGNLVVDLGTEVTPTVDGCFRFQAASAALASHVPYIVAATAQRGSFSWVRNIGFAKA